MALCGCGLGLVLVLRSLDSQVGPPLLAASVAAGLLFPLAGLLARAVWRRAATATLWAGVLVGWAALAPQLVGRPAGALLCFLAGGCVLAFGLPDAPPPPRLRVRTRRWWEPILNDPAYLLAVTFCSSGLLGGLLLALPWATTGPISLLDAFFTSFSAVCVTGLIVLDTPEAFTPAGQAMILLLIQVGGLGIMAFSTAALVLLGQRLSLRHEAALSQLFSNEDRGQLRDALSKVFAVTAGAELCGALALAALFWRGGDPLGRALWRGAFTSVSAFCNAGFALQSASLVPYQGQPAVLHVVALLIVVGGLGPAVVVLVPRALRGGSVHPQAKLVLAMSAFLLLAPALFVALAEWDRGLAGLGGPAVKLSNAWFQSVTLRTAGFNSIDLTQLQPATLTLMTVLMAIGGSPGGTAGGIKTTTVALLGLATWATIRGRRDVVAFGYSVDYRTLAKALASALLFAGGALLALIVLQLTQTIDFVPLTFEAVSALATVGLSLGATAELDSVGKLVVIACMFAGRVGPLTLMLLFARPERPGARWGRPRAEIATG